MRLCDRVIAMNKGQVIAEGPPAAVQADRAVVEAYLGRRHAAPAEQPIFQRAVQTT
jgi:branched-chain amino acid transport system permease protein